MWVDSTVFQLFFATAPVKFTGSLVAQSRANAMVCQRQGRPDPPDYKLEPSGGSMSSLAM